MIYIYINVLSKTNKKKDCWMYFDKLLKTSAPDKQPTNHVPSFRIINLSLSGLQYKQLNINHVI